MRVRAFALTLVPTLACAQPAAIVRRPVGPPIEAEIDSSDASTLRLRGPSGNLVSLGQYDVSEIDHPGNEWAMLGGLYVGGGALMLVPLFMEPAPGAAGPNGFAGIAALTGISGIAIGVAMLAYNLSTWGRSRSRAHAFEAARPPPWLIPPAVAGEPEPIAPLRPADGKDDEAPDKTPPTGFHR
jgi:hypothetical protein